MSGTSQITRLGPAELLQLEDGDGGGSGGGGGGLFQENNLSPALSDEEEVGGYPANRHIHQKNCQTIVCFFINKL